MSRKQTPKSVRSNKKSELERKRDERAARRAIVKDRKNRPQDGDEGAEFVSFSNQLQALGLKLREVPGDGNCLFRALGDQLEGHSRGHLRLRQETVQYMTSHRQDFEPFVEDDVPFAQHLSNLSQPGTFAGNDAIVAFARSQQVKVVIHQLNTPLWEINGVEKQVCRELHIAYRYGDHYDSVRRIGDNSESPAHLRIEVYNQKVDVKDGHIRGQQMNLMNVIHGGFHLAFPWWQRWLKSLKKRAVSWTNPVLADQMHQPKLRNWSCVIPQSIHHCFRHPQVSNKQRKEQQRQEKKKRQEERHRQKFIQSKGSQDQNQNLPEAVTLVPALNTLSI
uniref:OTU domain-containing protein 3 n=1 Tax=Acanthochromis polyacanthus TaxID=80966 RepID=A0A3Q1F6N9_9TELE